MTVDDICDLLVGVGVPSRFLHPLDCSWEALLRLASSQLALAAEFSLTRCCRGRASLDMPRVALLNLVVALVRLHSSFLF